MGGQRQDGRPPSLGGLPHGRAPGTAVSVQNYKTFTQKQAFALHFTFWIIFLLYVTSSRDLNLAEKITQRRDALIYQLGCFNLHN